MRGRPYLPINMWVVVLLLLGLAAVTVQAQVTTATVTGNIKDASGAVVLGAEITATNIDTNLARTTKSNDLGEYRIEFLPVGSYTISVAAQGFNKYVQKGIVLGINQIARIDATMKIGALTESVEVTSAAPLVNTSSAEIGQTVENVQIQALPLVGRNVYTLLDITPGVQQNTTTGLTLGYPEQKTLINGGSDGNYTGSVNYFLDGGTNMTGLRNTGNPLPNPDAIQEFRVQTNAYSAEYGRFANGVVNVLTKSGTNDFHGSAFEFWRNDKLNAAPWASQIGNGPLHRNQFGMTVGGPVRKDKTFFFFSYAGLRQNTSSLMQADVPTLAERGQAAAGSAAGSQDAVFPGLISDPLLTLPTTAGGKGYKCNATASPSGCFPNNTIPMARMDPTALYILNHFIPLPNPGITGQNNFQSFMVSPDNRNDYLAKIDHQLTPNQLLSGSFFTDSGINVINGNAANTLPWTSQQFKWRSMNLNVSDTQTINSSIVNQTWLVYTRMMGGRLNTCAATAVSGSACTSPSMSLADMGSSFNPQGTASMPDINVSPYFRLSSNIAGPKAGTNLYALRDVLSLNRGRHNIRFGGELSLEKDEQATLLNNYGVFSFDTSVSSDAFAAFLLGMPSSVKQDVPVTPATSTYNIAGFVQDDFRVRPRLTLNMGLRWDIQTPPVDSGDKLATYIPKEQSVVNPSVPVGLVFPGDPGVSRGIISTRWGHISPRFGFAYDPFGDGKTSIRGAAGIFWGSISGNEWNQSSNFQPFANRQTFPYTKTVGGPTLSNPYQGYANAPFPYTGTFTKGNTSQILGVSPGFDWPYTYQLNFSIQRQLTSTMSASVAYVGSMSHNLPFSFDANYPVLNSSSTTTNYPAQRPNQNFGPIFLTMSNQTSNYNSLQVTGSKRMSHNVNFTTSYVWSKTLCSVEVQGGTTGAAQDMNNLAAERGPCDSDGRHAFNLAMVYQPDYYHGESKVLFHFLNGWQIAPILRVRSGSPFSVTNGKDANLDGTNNDRAELVPGVSPYLPDPSATAWFNYAAFTQNVPKNGSPIDGNSPRNFLYGPGSKNVDLALSRTFKLSERFKLQFRGEATNVFNIVNLNNPDSAYADALDSAGNIKKDAKGNYIGKFGTITSAGTMRQLQLGLRLTF